MSGQTQGRSAGSGPATSRHSSPGCRRSRGGSAHFANGEWLAPVLDPRLAGCFLSPHRHSLHGAQGVVELQVPRGRAFSWSDRAGSRSAVRRSGAARAGAGANFTAASATWTENKLDMLQPTKRSTELIRRGGLRLQGRAAAPASFARRRVSRLLSRQTSSGQLTTLAGEGIGGTARTFRKRRCPSTRRRPQWPSTKGLDGCSPVFEAVWTNACKGSGGRGAAHRALERSRWPGRRNAGKSEGPVNRLRRVTERRDRDRNHPGQQNARTRWGEEQLLLGTIAGRDRRHGGLE